MVKLYVALFAVVFAIIAVVCITSAYEETHKPQRVTLYRDTVVMTQNSVTGHVDAMKLTLQRDTVIAPVK